MQSSTYAVKGNAAFAFQRRTFSSDRSATSTGIRFAGTKSLATTGSLYCSDSKAMGATLARADDGIQSVMSFSSVKARSVRAQASSGSSLPMLFYFCLSLDAVIAYKFLIYLKNLMYSLGFGLII